MSGQPVPIDLLRFADGLAGSREFLRLWAAGDGALSVFVNPVPIGPDPAAFGGALAASVDQAAKAYARAVSISEAEARARIWEGLDAERAAPAAAPPDLPPPPRRSADGVIEFTPKQDR